MSLHMPVAIWAIRVVNEANLCGNSRSDQFSKFEFRLDLRRTRRLIQVQPIHQHPAPQNINVYILYGGRSSSGIQVHDIPSTIVTGAKFHIFSILRSHPLVILICLVVHSLFFCSLLSMYQTQQGYSSVGCPWSGRLSLDFHLLDCPSLGGSSVI